MALRHEDIRIRMDGQKLAETILNQGLLPNMEARTLLKTYLEAVGSDMWRLDGDAMAQYLATALTNISFSIRIALGTALPLEKPSIAARHPDDRINDRKARTWKRMLADARIMPAHLGAASRHMDQEELEHLSCIFNGSLENDIAEMGPRESRNSGLLDVLYDIQQEKRAA